MEIYNLICLKMSENSENYMDITCYICHRDLKNDSEPTVVVDSGLEKLRCMLS